MGCSPPARQTCLPATPRSVSRHRTHKERSPACGSCGWVSPSGRKQNWLGPAGAALCPLIRHFRQGGGHCGYSSPAHSGGAWPGRASRALSPQPQGFQGSPSVRPACLHLDEGFRVAPLPGPSPPRPSASLSSSWLKYQTGCWVLPIRGLRPGPGSLGRAGKRGVRTPGLCLPEAAAAPTWEGVGAQLCPEAGRREPHVSARPGSCQAVLHLYQEGLLPPPGQLAGPQRKPAKQTA